MRTLITLAAVLIGTANVSAQTPAAGKLDDYLLRWEKAMAGVTTLSTEIFRRDTDKVFKTATEYTGWAAYMKTGTDVTGLNKAILELKPRGKAEFSEKVVCTGTHIYQYVPTRKEIHEHEMPHSRDGKVANNASMGLMFGMLAAAAKERFGLTLAKEDKDFIYVDVTPKKGEDKVEFQRAQLVLDRKTFLPRQVWLEQPNGNEVLWYLHGSAAGVKIDPRHFDKPNEPGWKIVATPKAGLGRPASR